MWVDKVRCTWDDRGVVWAGWHTWVDKVRCTWDERGVVGQVGICGLIRSDADGMTEES